MLNSRMLGILRTVTAKYLKETCTIERETLAEDNFGGRKHAWETVASDVPCRVITVGNRQESRGQDVGSQETLVDTYRLIVPYGTSLETNMRVTVGGLVYQVVSILSDRTDETDVQATLIRVRE